MPEPVSLSAGPSRSTASKRRSSNASALSKPPRSATPSAAQSSRASEQPSQAEQGSEIVDSPVNLLSARVSKRSSAGFGTAEGSTGQKSGMAQGRAVGQRPGSAQGGAVGQKRRSSRLSSLKSNADDSSVPIARPSAEEEAGTVPPITRPIADGNEDHKGDHEPGREAVIQVEAKADRDAAERMSPDTASEQRSHAGLIPVAGRSVEASGDAAQRALGPQAAATGKAQGGRIGEVVAVPQGDRPSRPATAESESENVFLGAADRDCISTVPSQQIESLGTRADAEKVAQSEALVAEPGTDCSLPTDKLHDTAPAVAPTPSQHMHPEDTGPPENKSQQPTLAALVPEQQHKQPSDPQRSSSGQATSSSGAHAVQKADHQPVLIVSSAETAAPSSVPAPALPIAPVAAAANNNPAPLPPSGRPSSAAAVASTPVTAVAAAASSSTAQPTSAPGAAGSRSTRIGQPNLPLSLGSRALAETPPVSSTRIGPALSKGLLLSAPPLRGTSAEGKATSHVLQDYMRVLLACSSAATATELGRS